MYWPTRKKLEVNRDNNGNGKSDMEGMPEASKYKQKKE